MDIALRFLLVLGWIAFCAPFVSNGQNQPRIDSLKHAITTENSQQNIVNNYLEIAEEFSHRTPDSALYYIGIALKVSQKTEDKQSQAEAFFMQSYYYDVKGNSAKAINSMKNAVQLFIEIGDSSYLSACYNNLGVSYSYGNKQKESLEYFIKAIQIGEALRDSFSLAEAYSNVGGFYDDTKEYSSALRYYKKALEVDLKYALPENIAVSYLDLGYINTKLRRYDDALTFLEKALVLKPQIEDPYFLTILHLRFAAYYSETNELELAYTNYSKAKELCEKYDYPMLRGDIQAIEGEVLVKQEKFIPGLLALDSAIATYRALNSENLIYDLYKHKAKAYSGLKMHNQAYKALQKADEREESPETNEIAETLGHFEKQEAQKEERERLQLEQELKDQIDENKLIKIQSRLYFTIYLSILLGAILILALYFYAIKRKNSKLLESNYELINHQKELLESSYSSLKDNEKRLAELNATKDKFFSIIAHDLKNPFNTLIGLSELLINNPEIKDTEDYEELMQGMFQTARSGHDLLENLLEWSRTQIDTIKNEPQPLALDTVFQATKTFFQEAIKTKNLTLYLPEETEQKVFADINMVTFITRNIVNNAIKFSYPGSQIEISSTFENGSNITCVKDYGTGMTPETIDKLFRIEHSVQKDGTNNEKGTGLGLILCKEFVEKSNGEIWVESTEGKGSCFCFKLPAC